jgi:hypothetical protein
MLKHNSSRTPWRIGFLVALLVAFTLIASTMFAQTTVATGSIVGTVTDASGAVVEGAKVTVTNVGTNETISLTSNSSGAYNSGALAPGSYKVQASAKGFSTISETASVQVGNTATVNIKLQVGQESTVVEVQGSTLAVNTEQAEVQGVLTSSQIDNLPVNGRNFLDLAQLEPGVQLQDGSNFDPTKAGYSSISFGGRFGRTARIDVDGVDISDETVGTTTQDIPASAISQFQLAQSSLDLSNDLTSSGAVNVTTKSGTNQFHGEAFGDFRDRSVGGAAPPLPVGQPIPPLQRSQFGGDFGGAIIKDKLFFFLDGERIKQDSQSTIQFPAPFDELDGNLTVPFRSSELMTRADYNLGHNARLFYRYNYFANSLPGTFGDGFSEYLNKDYSRTHVVGVDFNTGSYTHTIRFSYLKFQNVITDNTLGGSLPFCCDGITINASGNGLYGGPNPNAPQSTPQQNIQVKYDGSKSIRSHIVRYGVAYNHIQGGGFASFFGFAPRVRWTQGTEEENFARTGPYPTLPGGTDQTPANNPLNYPVETVRYGNGLGFNTLEPALGFPAGGLGPDNRLGLYFGDSWKVKPNFTVSAGVRYNRDTGRTDSDLPADAAINAQFPGWGNAVKQSNTNFSPELGIAWDPARNGKTVVRAGIGIYYENVIYNNVLFDRPLRLQTGAFNQTPNGCAGGTPQLLLVAGGTLTPDAGSCGSDVRVGDAIPAILDTWAKYKAGNPLDLQAANPNYVGNALAAGLSEGPALFAPNYKTPRSLQMNVGIQREIRRGMVLSADYLRNVETHSLLGIDINQAGDISHFSLANAQAAIATTNAQFGCASVDCAIGKGAQMTDYAGNGLTADLDFGQACNQAIGVPCAFPGKNANQAQSIFLKPIGRSTYTALQMKLVENTRNPFRGMSSLNFQVAYSLSRFENSGGAQVTGTAGDSDQDFVIGSPDQNQPNKYFGPSLLDRTHQISFGGFGELPMHVKLGLIAHFYSPLSSALVVPNNGVGNGEIFRSDLTGDGTVQDPIPGTKFGDFDRKHNAHALQGVISNYNTKFGNQPTPAGNVLVNQGVMTVAQLQALGGVAPILATPPPDQQNFTWLRNFDANVAYSYKFFEKVSLEPSVAFFNLFNFGNFNLPPSTMRGLLDGSPGSINGTAKIDNEAFRVGNGTGVYAVGAPRQTEFGLKIVF